MSLNLFFHVQDEMRFAEDSIACRRGHTGLEMSIWQEKKSAIIFILSISFSFVIFWQDTGIVETTCPRM